MNFLAHLHIAEHTRTSFTGNFLGDFVKGNPANQYSDALVQGIRLHRAIDSFTDTHEITKQAKRYFPEQLKRYAPIALDMFWDHCLARDWRQFHSLTLRQFCQRTEAQINREVSETSEALPERFIRVNHWVWQDKWLESYIEVDNIVYALERMSTRSKRLAHLADTGSVLVEHQQELRELFGLLYPQVLKASVDFITQERS